MSHEPTMKLVTNLDRAAIEAKLLEVGSDAAAAGRRTASFTGLSGLPSSG